MGAWGEGMQANDTALDAIDRAGLSSAEPKRREKTLAALRGGKKKVEDLFKGWVKDSHEGVLGLAEFLFDEGIDIKPVMSLVKKALRNQLGKRELSRWRDSEERQAALARFKDRLEGKEVDQELLEADNEGLLSKMAKRLSR